MTENKKERIPTDLENRAYTIKDIQEILHVSQPTAYNLVKKNLFRVVKVGRNIRISKKSFDEWLDNQDSF